jgi:hypothetical protein
MATYNGRKEKTVAQGIALLKGLHATGLRQRAAHPGRLPYGSPGTFNEKETIRKARKFADPDKGYNAAELKQLLDHCRRKRFALYWYHIILLLGVADKKSRRQLQTAAIDNKWSINRLRDAIFKTRGNLRPKAGRRYNAADMTDHRLRLQQICSEWDRSLAGYEKWAAADANTGKPSKFPPRIARQIAVVSKELHRLRELLASQPPSR